MDSFLSILGIQQGLGDCLIAAAVCQKLSRLNNNSKVKFHTNKLIHCLFDGHPNIEITEDLPTFSFKWPSQINRSLFNLHTMQRFASQLNMMIDPTDVVDIYVKGNHIVNKQSNIVCINDCSAEPTRRFIPKHIVELLYEEITKKGYEVYFIGNSMVNKSQSYSDISKCVDLLKNSKLFIGPVSFQYHLASALRTKCMLFTSYMPYYKYSHFFNTEHISSNMNCVKNCEEFENLIRNENDCWSGCKAIEYDVNEIKFKLNKLL